MTSLTKTVSQCYGVMYRTLKLNRFIAVPICIFLGIEVLLLSSQSGYQSSVIPNLNFSFVLTLQSIFVLNFVQDKNSGFVSLYKTMGLRKVPYVLFQFVCFLLFSALMMVAFYLVYVVMRHKCEEILIGTLCY